MSNTQEPLTPKKVNLIPLVANLDGTDYYTGLLRTIVKSARICYQSQEKEPPTQEADEKFVATLISNGHESVLEHANLRVLFTIDRGTSHELVRHRLLAVSQESTRYCNYAKKGMQFINPNCMEQVVPLDRLNIHIATYAACEEAYNKLIEMGATPQEARQVLPQALATRVMVTANIREWRHILKLRTSPQAHPMIRSVMIELLHNFHTWFPVFFKDIPLEPVGNAEIK